MESPQCAETALFKFEVVSENPGRALSHRMALLTSDRDVGATGVPRIAPETGERTHVISLNINRYAIP